MSDAGPPDTHRSAAPGERRRDLPDVGFGLPDPAFAVPEDERPGRVETTTDLCTVDGRDHFVRGVIELPVRDRDETFGIGVWVSQSEANFAAYRADFENFAPDRPTFGWLSNDFSFGGEPTWGLKTNVHFRAGGLRPRVELQRGDHPLAVAQRDGSSPAEVRTFLHATFGDEIPDLPDWS